MQKPSRLAINSLLEQAEKTFRSEAKYSNQNFNIALNMPDLDEMHLHQSPTPKLMNPLHANIVIMPNQVANILSPITRVSPMMVENQR